jgi:hypothetical protein
MRRAAAGRAPRDRGDSQISTRAACAARRGGRGTPMLDALPGNDDVGTYREATAAVQAAKSRLRPKRDPGLWPQRPGRPAAAAASCQPCCSSPCGSDSSRNVTIVEDATTLSPAQFREQFEVPCCPALLCGLLRDWPALPPPATAPAAAAASPKERSSRCWTLPNLVRRLGGKELACGDDTTGENVTLPFSAFVIGYLRGCLDRNPLFVFDATCIEVGALMAPGPGSQQQPCSTDANGGATATGPASGVPRHDGDLSADYCAPAIFAEVSQAFPSWNWSIWTEIYLWHACSYHKIEDGNARAG